MTKRTLSLLAAMAASTLGLGCVEHVASPPLNGALLEGAAPLAPDQTGVQASVGTQGEVLGPHVSGGSLRVRHGLPRNVDVSAEASGHVVDGSADDGGGSEPRGIYTARVATKWAPRPKFFAMTVGFGGGRHAAGGFWGFDVGPILSYENRWATPFLSARLLVSQPLHSKWVYLGDDVYDRPQTTVGLNTTAGLRFPMGEDTSAAIPIEGNYGALVLAATYNGLFAGSSQQDPDGSLDRMHLFGAYLGGEVVF